MSVDVINSADMYDPTSLDADSVALSAARLRLTKHHKYSGN